MKILLLSYSLSGNNKALAKRMAVELSATLLPITEKSKRGFFRISMDLLFNRTPKVQPNHVPIADYDFIILNGPIWMGKVAFPLRSCLNQLKNSTNPYAFVAISGGTGGVHPQLVKELTKRVGRKPSTIIDLHISDFVISDSTPTYKMVSDYKLTTSDYNELNAKAVNLLKKVIR